MSCKEQTIKYTLVYSVQGTVYCVHVTCVQVESSLKTDKGSSITWPRDHYYSTFAVAKLSSADSPGRDTVEELLRFRLLSPRSREFQNHFLTSSSTVFFDAAFVNGFSFTAATQRNTM